MNRLDRRGSVDFVDAVATPADACPADRSTLLARFHVLEDGRLLSGAAAFAAMWRAVPILRPLGLLAKNRILLAMLEKLYAGFLIIRPQLQGLAYRLERR